MPEDQNLKEKRQNLPKEADKKFTGEVVALGYDLSAYHDRNKPATGKVKNCYDFVSAHDKNKTPASSTTTIKTEAQKPTSTSSGGNQSNQATNNTKDNKK